MNNLFWWEMRINSIRVYVNSRDSLGLCKKNLEFFKTSYLDFRKDIILSNINSMIVTISKMYSWTEWRISKMYSRTKKKMYSLLVFLVPHDRYLTLLQELLTLVLPEAILLALLILELWLLQLQPWDWCHLRENLNFVMSSSLELR